MPLPILHTTSASPETLIRLFHQTERDYVRHLSEETSLDVGTAFHNAQLNNVYDANCVLDAALPPTSPESASPAGITPAEAIREATDHFASVGSTLHRWILNPSLPADRTEPLARQLIGQGFVPRTADILHLASAPPGVVREVGGLMIIPSRASFRHARQLAEEAAARWNEPQLADASMLHLDDPHWDSLLALRDGTPVAHIAVLAVGEVGRIEDVFVSEKFRRLGIGRTMMSRALEICARSLFKHVMLMCGPENSAAQSLYASLGFKKIGEMTAFNKPALAASQIEQLGSV